MKDTYHEPVTYTYPNAIVRVYSPILTEEERAARMKRVHDAAARLLMACEKERRK